MRRELFFPIDPVKSSQTKWNARCSRSNYCVFEAELLMRSSISAKQKHNTNILNVYFQHHFHMKMYTDSNLMEIRKHVKVYLLSQIKTQFKIYNINVQFVWKTPKTPKENSSTMVINQRSPNISKVFFSMNKREVFLPKHTSAAKIQTSSRAFVLLPHCKCGMSRVISNNKTKRQRKWPRDQLFQLLTNTHTDRSTHTHPIVAWPDNVQSHLSARNTHRQPPVYPDVLVCIWTWLNSRWTSVFFFPLLEKLPVQGHKCC